MDSSNHNDNPLQKPKSDDDFLSSSLSKLSPKKQEEFHEKAANEALRLKVKQTESQIDQNLAQDQIKNAQELAHDASRNKLVDQYKIETEHKSEHGYTRATFQRGCFSVILLYIFVIISCIGFTIIIIF